jgi:hypothetical protein
MNISDIKCVVSSHKMSDIRDLSDYQNINNMNSRLADEKTVSQLMNGDRVEANVVVEYLNSSIHVGEKEFPTELTTLDTRKKKRIENSNEPCLLKGILKFNPIKEKCVLTDFIEIELSLGLDIWISIVSQLSLDEFITEILSGLNMNSSKLNIKEKHMFLARLIPLIQKQYLLIDFSKRSTRKTRTYLDLGYYIPAAYNFTRAKIIYDQSQRKKGLIFNPKGGCLILDEFQNNTDDGITMGIQQYKNDGTISDDKGNTMLLSTSIIILGNPKICINYPFLFRNWQNIFEGTTIYKKNTSTGDAFLSRGDYLIPSWESRPISNEMILDINIKRIPPYILRSIFAQLREIDISDKVKTIIRNLNLKTDRYDSRSQKAIERTFEGLIKLLLPQLIKNNDYENYQKELHYLYSLALEGRIIINNMLQKIKPENIPTNFYFSTASYFDKEKTVFILPHRKITIRGNEVVKEALDSIGILQSQKEIYILKKYRIKYQGNNLCFRHPYSLPNLFKDNLLTELKDKCKEYKPLILGIGGVIIVGGVAAYCLSKSKKLKFSWKILAKEFFISTLKGDSGKILNNLKNNISANNPKGIKENTTPNLWSDNIFFNYLLGEEETTIYSKKDIDFLKNISFYYK